MNSNTQVTNIHTVKDTLRTMTIGKVFVISREHPEAEPQKRKAWGSRSTADSFPLTSA